MSNALAIATVTSALRNLLMQVTTDLPDTVVTAKPPHKARSGQEHGNQLNLFLYQVAPNAAWQNNQPASQQSHKSPPLALNLYYFLTAYGRDDEDILGHRLLGKAMVILHQHKVLHPQELKLALPGNELYQQSEQIRIAPHPLTPEELSKLWSVFQFPYGLSVAYQVSVVVINSVPAPVHPLSEVQHTVENGEQAVPCIISPVLKSLELPKHQDSLGPGELFTLHGHGLHGDQLEVQIHHLQLPHLKHTALPMRRQANQLTVQFPEKIDAKTPFAPGFYRISLAIQRVNCSTQYTNALVIAVASDIQSVHFLSSQPLNGQIELKLICRMAIYPEQSTMLIISNPHGFSIESVKAEPLVTASAELHFCLDKSPAQGSKLILQVDGVNSVPFPLDKLQVKDVSDPLSNKLLEVNPR